MFPSPTAFKVVLVGGKKLSQILLLVKGGKLMIKIYTDGQRDVASSGRVYAVNIRSLSPRRRLVR